MSAMMPAAGFTASRTGERDKGLVRRDRWVHGLTRDGGPEIHFVEHGSGEPVLLLHGFPDFWYMWRHQIPVLAKAGYRAIALDMRGYNRSDAPTSPRQYRMPQLTRDVVRVMDALGIQKATVVGHDWGGIVAWSFAAEYPERLHKLVVINAPHPSAYRKAILRSSQLLRSWYVFAFQVPRVPEWLLARSRMRRLRRIWANAGGQSGNVTPTDVEKYEKAFSREGRIRATVNYYRAAAASFFDRAPGRAVTAPTLLIWGEQDPFLVSGIPEWTKRCVANLRIQKLAEAGHWPQLETPEQVNAAIVEFLAHE